MNVRIVIDSTADVTDAVRSECTIVPLTLHFGETEYADGVTITHEEFYEMLAHSDVLPTTSQPTPAAFAEVYEAAVNAGQQVVVITVSSKLSGTYQSACIAAMDYPDSVYVVDSQTAALGSGILAEMAVSLTRSGMNAADIARRLDEEKHNICLIAMVDTLEYLKRGGRISKTVAFAGELLSIKPIISIQNGEIAILGKARGSKQGNSLLVKQIQAAGGVDFGKPLLLGYTGQNDTLLQKYINDSTPLWEAGTDVLNTTVVGSVIGAHAGPGAVAIAFFKKQ